VLLKIVYGLTCRTLGLVVVLVRGDRAIAAEMLVLRHENAVLRRQAGRVRYEPVDRAWFAALARIVSRRRWAEVFPVTPATLRELAGQLATQRANTVAWIIDGIRDRAALRAGITRRHAIDQVWLLMDPAVYHRLTRYRGWSPAGYEQWFTGTITRLLLD
jgi:hypothetical protein